MLSAQLLRRAMEVFGKLPDRTEIAADRGRRVVAPLKLVEHALAKWGHGNLLPMTSHPSPASLPSLTTTLSPSRQRLRSNRLVRNMEMSLWRKPKAERQTYVSEAKMTC